MTRQEVFTKIMDTAMAHGFQTGYNKSSDSYPWISDKSARRYTNIQLTEKYDVERTDYKNGIYAGHIEISASVSRMGGNPDAEELLDAADQIRRAGELVKAFESMDLSYRETANDEAA